MESLTGVASGDVRYAPESRHWRHCKASDSKSGHPRSALPPKADIRTAVEKGLLMTQSGHSKVHFLTAGTSLLWDPLGESDISLHLPTRLALSVGRSITVGVNPLLRRHRCTPLPPGGGCSVFVSRESSSRACTREATAPSDPYPFLRGRVFLSGASMYRQPMKAQNEVTISFRDFVKAASVVDRRRKHLDRKKTWGAQDHFDLCREG